MNKLIAHIENITLFTNRIAFVRLLLALNALLLLLFTDIPLGTDLSLLDLPNIQDSLFKPFSIFTVFGAQIGNWLSILILFFAITGYFPKISILLQAWVHLSICNSVIVIEGGDQIASNLCILLIPICLFDPRRNQWAELKNQEANQKNVNIFLNIYSFLIRLQVAVIYLHSTTGKLIQNDWLDGTCLYYWTTNNVFGTATLLQPLLNFITLSDFAPLISWSVIFFELGLFACIFATNKYIRRFFLFSGIFFHFGILITHGLVAFFFSMCAALILYLDFENSVFNRIKLLLGNIKGYRSLKLSIIKSSSHGNK